MNKHWRYFSYVLRHKWFVFVECCKLGVHGAALRMTSASSDRLSGYRMLATSTETTSARKAWSGLSTSHGSTTRNATSTIGSGGYCP